MSSPLQNLSSYDPSDIPSGEGLRIGIVVSAWNQEVTDGLLRAAVDTLNRHGVLIDDIMLEKVPGSFELPLGAQLMAENTDADAILCLGCVIQGETRHFEFISQAVSHGIMRVGLDFSVPVIFGVLTTDTLEQARARSGGEHGNKGTEAALTALQMAALQHRLEDGQDASGFE